MTAGQSDRGILVACGPWDPDPWLAAISAAAPNRPVQVWPETPQPDAVRYVFAWAPKEGALTSFPNLEVIFSLGAGVDHIIFQKSLPDVPIVRVVNLDLTQRMTEWVVLHVLLHHRRQRRLDQQQQARLWQSFPQPAAADVRVGVMGAGVLGRDATEALMRLGFKVATWSRRPAKVAGAEAFHGSAGLDAFLARTDIIVSLLPLTAETRGILAMPLFRKLARDGALGGPVLLNAGRGGLQVEADIVAAIEQGVLVGASLDVFEREPLDEASPLWSFDNVVITPHAAAWSEPTETTGQILEQIAAYERGEPLRNVVDRSAGY